RLFKMEQGMSLGSSPFIEEELQQLVQGSFYQPASWKRSTLSVAAEFSAVAYYFARNLQNSLNVAVASSSNAIGCTPTQAWISSEALQRDSELEKYVAGGEDDCLSVEEVPPFISSRVKENLGEAVQDGRVDAYKHPFSPAYLYDYGI